MRQDHCTLLSRTEKRRIRQRLPFDLPTTVVDLFLSARPRVLFSPFFGQHRPATGTTTQARVGHFDADAQTMTGLKRVRGVFQQHMANLAGATPASDKYSVYPEQVVADFRGPSTRASQTP